MSKALPKWDTERVTSLLSIVGDVKPVTPELVVQAAESLKTTERSVASKLRNMDIEVVSTAKDQGKKYTEDEEAEITAFLNAHPVEFTYAEIATQVLSGSRSAKQIQGKILSMDATALVKPTEKVEHEKKFSDAEEVKLLALLAAVPAMFIEDIATEMDREVPQIRGKILSLTRVHPDIEIPKQKVYKAKVADAFEELGNVSKMTVKEIAEAIDKTERGVKVLLTHRGISCDGHDGAKKKAANDAKKDAA